MIKRTKTWYSGLSKIGKITVWAITAVIFGSMAAGASPAQNNASTITQPKPQVVTAKEEKKVIKEEFDVPFEKVITEDSSMSEGTTKVTIKGVNGVKTLTYEVTIIDGKEVSKRQISEEITKEPINEITVKGTKVAQVNQSKPQRNSSNCDPNYTPCVPNVSYDLDCPDIGFGVQVIGSDPHRFDRDGDGYGCEAY